jgi:hypothetical protein
MTNDMTNDVLEALTSLVTFIESGLLQPDGPSLPDWATRQELLGKYLSAGHAAIASAKGR